MGMLGHRRAGALELFAAGGWLIQPRASQWAPALIGMVIHGVWVLLWSMLLVSIAGHHRGMRATLDVIATATVAFATAVLLPSPLVGPLATLTTGELVLVHLVLAMSMVIGMRLAPPRVTRGAGDESVPERG